MEERIKTNTDNRRFAMRLFKAAADATFACIMLRMILQLGGSFEPSPSPTTPCSVFRLSCRGQMIGFLNGFPMDET